MRSIIIKLVIIVCITFVNIFANDNYNSLAVSKYILDEQLEDVDNCLELNISEDEKKDIFDIIDDIAQYKWKLSCIKDEKTRMAYISKLQNTAFQMLKNERDLLYARSVENKFIQNGERVSVYKDRLYPKILQILRQYFHNIRNTKIDQDHVQDQIVTKKLYDFFENFKQQYYEEKANNKENDKNNFGKKYNNLIIFMKNKLQELNNQDILRQYNCDCFCFMTYFINDGYYIEKFLYLSNIDKTALTLWLASEYDYPDAGKQIDILQALRYGQYDGEKGFCNIDNFNEYERTKISLNIKALYAQNKKLCKRLVKILQTADGISCLMENVDNNISTLKKKIRKYLNSIFSWNNINTVSQEEIMEIFFQYLFGKEAKIYFLELPQIIIDKAYKIVKYKSYKIVENNINKNVSKFKKKIREYLKTIFVLDNINIKSQDEIIEISFQNLPNDKAQIYFSKLPEIIICKPYQITKNINDYFQNYVNDIVNKNLLHKCLNNNFQDIYNECTAKFGNINHEIIHILFLYHAQSCLVNKIANNIKNDIMRKIQDDILSKFTINDLHSLCSILKLSFASNIENTVFQAQKQFNEMLQNLDISIDFEALDFTNVSLNDKKKILTIYTRVLKNIYNAIITEAKINKLPTYPICSAFRNIQNNIKKLSGTSEESSTKHIKHLKLISVLKNIPDNISKDIANSILNNKSLDKKIDENILQIINQHDNKQDNIKNVLEVLRKGILNIEILYSKYIKNIKKYSDYSIDCYLCMKMRYATNCLPNIKQELVCSILSMALTQIHDIIMHNIENINGKLYDQSTDAIKIFSSVCNNLSCRSQNYNKQTISKNNTTNQSLQLEKLKQLSNILEKIYNKVSIDMKFNEFNDKIYDLYRICYYCFEESFHKSNFKIINNINNVIAPFFDNFKSVANIQANIQELKLSHYKLLKRRSNHDSRMSKEVTIINAFASLIKSLECINTNKLNSKLYNAHKRAKYNSKRIELEQINDSELT